MLRNWMHVEGGAQSYALLNLPYVMDSPFEGGFGHNWGLKLTQDGRRILTKPEPAPFFDGLEGAERLHLMVLEYGPMWQVSGDVMWGAHPHEFRFGYGWIVCV